MSKKILITDSLFIKDKHVKQLEAAGFEVERLDKPEATEEELCHAVKGKAGYILGGTEMVTGRVVESADQLEVIIFTGISYKAHIPAWELVMQKGIAIANAPDSPTHAVAEWAIAVTLMMNRSLLELGPMGATKFQTTIGLENQVVGILGLGRIGRQIAEMIQVFRPKAVLYSSRQNYPDVEASLAIKFVDKQELFKQSNVLFVCVSFDAGVGYVAGSELASMPKGALLVNFANSGVIEIDPLYQQLKSGRIRAVSDYILGDQFNNLPTDSWYVSSSSTAFNTATEVELTSDTVVASMINLLTTGDDKYLVNTDYRENKKAA